VPKAGGTLQYLSKVKSYLVKKFPEIDSVTFEAGSWYKTLRQNVFSEYLSKSVQEGTELRKPHKNMSIEEHSYVGRTLFEADTRESHNDRYSLNFLNVALPCIFLHLNAVFHAFIA
jgi:hypothetical protein